MASPQASPASPGRPSPPSTAPRLRWARALSVASDGSARSRPSRRGVPAAAAGGVALAGAVGGGGPRPPQGRVAALLAGQLLVDAQGLFQELLLKGVAARLLVEQALGDLHVHVVDGGAGQA